MGKINPCIDMLATNHALFIRLLTIKLFLFSTGACAYLENAETEQKPNIVFLMIDDLGWQDLGFMGSNYYKTPNIDALAAQGMTFTNAYASGPNCAPTRASLMSGQYPSRHGIQTVFRSNTKAAGFRYAQKVTTPATLRDLDTRHTTLAEAFKAAGYRTAHMGKWHLGEDEHTNPLAQGFDINIGGNSSGAPRGGYFSPYNNPNLRDGPKGEYLSDRLTNEALTFIGKNNAKPFFLYLSYYAVHTPLQGKTEKIARYNAVPKTRQQGKPVYAAMVESVDENIGKLLTELKRLRLDKNTIVVFTSDNGGHYPATSMPSLRNAKGTLYEGGIRIPLTVRWPGVIAPQSKSDRPVITIDHYPTLLELANIKTPKNVVLDGTSLAPILRGESSFERNTLYWHFPFYLRTHRKTPENDIKIWRQRPASVIREGNYKLIEYLDFGGIELYDLADDLRESHNLALQRPELALRLRKKLFAWRLSLNIAPTLPDNPHFNSQYTERTPSITWQQILDRSHNRRQE